jgi:REP element-mobilizing transposase RayT
MNAYHVTWSTHNSRVSERMMTYRVKRGEPISLEDALELEVTQYIAQIVKENNLKVLAYNICQDHVHIILACYSDELSSNIAKLKGKSAFLFKKAREITDTFHLWGQKFHAEEILTDEQLEKTMNYANFNREKHGLPPSKGLQPLVTAMITPVTEAFVSVRQKNTAGGVAAQLVR